MTIGDKITGSSIVILFSHVIEMGVLVPLGLETVTRGLGFPVVSQKMY